MRDGRASRTAEHNALFRALDARRPADERVADDRLAIRFLPRDFRFVSELARVGPLRRAIESFIDRRWPGPRAGVVVRTRYIDDLIADVVGDVTQMVILGAGLDSRAYRLAALRDVAVFEVDHPSTQRAKRARVVEAIRDVPANVSFVPVDFDRDRLEGRLAGTGFVAGAQTLVLWEGVTNYLTAEAVDDGFRTIAGIVAPGSPVVFTYIDRRMLDGDVAFDGALESSVHVERVGEPYTFGFRPDELSSFLHERGFALTSDLSVPEFAVHYGDIPNGYGYYRVAHARRV